ncbi:MAG TPA: MFS transporter, partial [Candidatus Bathyarchaeia archaeon]|nr:MFS transporter [Candidatus Bathyarchaeia archaeon]
VSLLVLNFNVVVPLVARDVLHEGAHGFGLLMSCLGTGAVVAALGLTLLRRGRPPLWFVVACAATLGVGTAGLGLVQHFGAAAALLVVLGCCQILFSTGCNSMLQLETPNALRGRVMGLYALSFAGMTPFGSLLVGAVAQHLGVRAACALGGGSGLVALAILVLVGRSRGVTWTHGSEPFPSPPGQAEGERR